MNVIPTKGVSYGPNLEYCDRFLLRHLHGSYHVVQGADKQDPSPEEYALFYPAFEKLCQDVYAAGVRYFESIGPKAMRTFQRALGLTTEERKLLDGVTEDVLKKEGHNGRLTVFHRPDKVCGECLVVRNRSLTCV